MKKLIPLFVILLLLPFTGCSFGDKDAGPSGPETNIAGEPMSKPVSLEESWRRWEVFLIKMHQNKIERELAALDKVANQSTVPTPAALAPGTAFDDPRTPPPAPAPAPTPNPAPAPATSPADSNKVMFYAQPEEAPAGTPAQIFKIGNDNKVANGGTTPSFTTAKDYYVTDLWTYHWNNGAGAAAGTLSLKSSDGKTYGPWQSDLTNGVYWSAKINQTLPAGTYQVLDSDPSTLAQNSGTAGMGMAWMNGIPKN